MAQVSPHPLCGPPLLQGREGPQPRTMLSLPGCAAPMVYVDCSDTPAGTPGAECLRSCHTLDVDCVSGPGPSTAKRVRGPGLWTLPVPQPLTGSCPCPQFSTHCVSGCVCPTGLVSDGSGGCVAEEDCPCLHNEAAYQPGQTIRVGCNTW